MPAAPAAIPPNPKIAAITAITKKIIIQRTIVFEFFVLVYYETNNTINNITIIYMMFNIYC